MSLYPELMASVLYQATGSSVCVFLTLIFIFLHIYEYSKLYAVILLSLPLFSPTGRDYWSQYISILALFLIARNICYCFICYKLAYEWNPG